MADLAQIGRYIAGKCGLRGAGRALASFPRQELVGVGILIVFFGWLLGWQYGAGLLVGFVAGVQVGRRMPQEES